jgi:hypothetical protein
MVAWHEDDERLAIDHVVLDVIARLNTGCPNDETRTDLEGRICMVSADPGVANTTPASITTTETQREVASTCLPKHLRLLARSVSGCVPCLPFVLTK